MGMFLVKFVLYGVAHFFTSSFVHLFETVEWVRAVCARLGGKVVVVEGLTDVLADKSKIN